MTNGWERMATSSNDQNDKRSNRRVGIGAVLPIHVVRAADGACIPCRIIDASSSGIGVLSDGELALGDVIIFKTVRRSFPLKVTWCEKTERGFKCGLELADPSQDLEALFTAYRHYKAAV